MKKKKWLEYIKGNYEPDDVFYTEMVTQLPILFENLLSKKIDWTNLILFVEPIDWDKILSNKVDEFGQLYTSLICSLVNRKTDGSIDGSVAWYIDTKDQEPFKAPTSGNKLIFFLEDFEKCKDWFSCIPELPSMGDRIKLYILFEQNGIAVKYESIQHEGIYAIKLNGAAIEGKEKEILEALNTYRNAWNKLSKEKGTGLFHNILLDSIDKKDNQYFFYYDMGSSNLEAHKYILGHLIESTDNVIKIMIDTL